MGGALFLCLVVLPAFGLAQDMPYGKWWRIPRVEKQLELTDEDKAKLEEKFVESRRKLIDLKSNVEREQFELDNLLDGESLDEGAVMDQFRKLEQARGDLSAERFSFLLEVRRVLGFERFHKIKTLYELRQQRKARKGDHLSPRKERLREMPLRGDARRWDLGPDKASDM